MSGGPYEDDGWRHHPERARRVHEVDLVRRRSRETGGELPPGWEEMASEFIAGTIDEREFGRRVSASQPLRTVFLHGPGYDPIRAVELKCLHFTVEVTDAGIYWSDGDSNTPQDRQRITQDDFLTLWACAPQHPLVARGDDAGTALMWVFPAGQWPAMYAHAYPR